MPRCLVAALVALCLLPSAALADEEEPDIWLEPVAETGLRRDAFIDDAPPGLVGAVFALDPGAVALVEGDGMVALARLDSIAPYDRNDAEMAALRGALAGAQADGIASDLYTLFTVAVRDAAGISLDPAAINAVHAQFP